MPTIALQQSGLRGPLADVSSLKAAWDGLSLRFKRDERGNIALIFALTLGAICMSIGGAVDIGRWLNARDQTVSAIDAAILAAGRMLQTGATESAAITTAKNVYAANTRKRTKVLRDGVTFVVTNNGANVSAMGTVELRTPFLQFVKISKLPLFEPNESFEATTAQDRFLRFNKEVSIMLDTSGSMCSPCSKRDTMKVAAKDLIDTLMRNNSSSSQFKARIAVIPFSGDVRPPQTWLASLINPVTYAAGSFTISWGKNNKNSQKYRISACVGERSGTEKYTKAAPGVGAYLVPSINDTNGSCVISSSNTLMPLSDDNAALKARVDALVTGGSTAGHVGTAWAYYMLSPQWNSIIPAANRPADYGSDNLRKIAILMTDGEYNMERDVNGLSSDLSGYAGISNGIASAQQAVNICTNMKNDDIEVFTVGFDLGGNQTAINTLSSCATDASHFYNAVDNAALLQAFRDISIKLTDLHLSK